MANPVGGVNVIVAAGSIDGIAGTAACIRHSKNFNIKTDFTQAHQVTNVDLTKWAPKSKVGFIDLAVNNQGQSANPQMTIDFVKKIKDAGHEILFIADEHGKEAWAKVLTTCDLDVKALTIQPENKDEYKSSCAILEKYIGQTADAHTKELLDGGHQGDLMNFDTRFGRIFNRATKSNIMDQNRRSYLAGYMAEHETPDTKIQGWMDEYAEMEANLPLIINTREDLGDDISRYDAESKRHDATEVFTAAYKKSPVAVLRNIEVTIEGKRQLGVCIATNNIKGLNVLQAIQGANIVASGVAVRANFALKDEQAAIEAVRAALKKLPT